MKRIQNILLIVLIALVGNAFGQETNGWEFDYLHGKVKTYTEFHYTFDISDSINHDEFMIRFYQCGFDITRMIHFGDSIKSERDHKSCGMKEFDSLGYYTKWSYNNNETYYQNEYDSHGQLLRRIIIDDVDTADTISFLYDSVGRLIERRYTDYQYLWDYDSDGRLVEYRYTDIILDSVLILEKYEFDKEGVLRKKESFDNRKEGNGSVYCEYDSKGNVVFQRREDIGYSHVVETRSKYKYDRNDSIIKETSRETRWWNTEIQSNDDRWQETDSTGQVVEYVNYKVTVAPNAKKEKLKYERIIKRNAEGFPVKEKYVQKDKYGKTVSYSEYDGFGRVVKIEYFYNDDTIPSEVKKCKYDGWGRLIERERIDNRHAQFHKQVWRYYKDTDFYSYYATYGGENYDISHESLFFFDEHGNCIAHIQWMPGADLYEYYFNVYRCEYYE